LSRGRRGRTLLGAALLAPLVWAEGCSLLVDDEPLTRGCAGDEKACDGRCVSKSDPEYGCDAESCQPCVLPNSTAICDARGHCAVAACVDSYEDCDGDSANGCEVNLDTDVDHCGACDAPACEVPGAVAACARGACAIRRCEPGFRDCNRLDADGCETALTRSDVTTGSEASGGDASVFADAAAAPPACDPWASD
jgi:hypothetical protein